MGNKNSGRRTKYEEVHINELAGISVRWGVDNWNDLAKSEKMKILIALGPKYVIQKLQAEFEIDLKGLLGELQQDEQEGNRIGSVN